MIRRILCSSLTLLAAVCLLSAPAAAIPTIRLSATRIAVMSDGHDTTEIIAEVRDTSGNMAPDGTPVSFNTNLGQFQGSNPVPTRAGMARVRLASAQKG